MKHGYYVFCPNCEQYEVKDGENIDLKVMLARERALTRLITIDLNTGMYLINDNALSIGHHKGYVIYFDDTCCHVYSQDSEVFKNIERFINNLCI